MSLSQTYFLAHTARAKLAREAAQADHRLGRLVGHANLLDSLMGDLALAEREQEQWFDQTVSGAVLASSDGHRPVSLAEAVVEAPGHDWAIEDADSDSSDSESDDDGDDDEVQADEMERRERVVQGSRLVHVPSFKTIPASSLSISSFSSSSPSPLSSSTDVTVTVTMVDEAEEYEDDEAHLSDLALVRTSSRPPPLLQDSDEDESEDDMPPSPPQQLLHDFSDRQRKAISTTSYYDVHRLSTPPTRDPKVEYAPLFHEEYFLPRPTPSTAVSAF